MSHLYIFISNYVHLIVSNISSHKILKENNIGSEETNTETFIKYSNKDINSLMHRVPLMPHATKQKNCHYVSCI